MHILIGVKYLLQIHITVSTVNDYSQRLTIIAEYIKFLLSTVDNNGRPMVSEQIFTFTTISY